MVSNESWVLGFKIQSAHPTVSALQRYPLSPDIHLPRHIYATFQAKQSIRWKLVNAKHRKTMVSSGDRSAKIRTYNYPQGRVTEYRIGLTKYNLQNVMGGDIQEFIDELQLAENAEKLKVGTTIS